MTCYLLDTNIISQVTRPEPAAALLTWLAAQLDRNLFISTLCLAEIRRGILQAPRGKRRMALQAWFAGPEGPQALFTGRILPLDEAAVLVWADLMAAGSRHGTPRSALDMIIVATAAAHGCVVATSNIRHFRGVVEAFDPTRES